MCSQFCRTRLGGGALLRLSKFGAMSRVSSRPHARQFALHSQRNSFSSNSMRGLKLGAMTGKANKVEKVKTVEEKLFGRDTSADILTHDDHRGITLTLLSKNPDHAVSIWWYPINAGSDLYRILSHFWLKLLIFLMISGQEIMLSQPWSS
jgi:hypothetical protein